MQQHWLSVSFSNKTVLVEILLIIRQKLQVYISSHKKQNDQTAQLNKSRKDYFLMHKTVETRPINAKEMSH